VTWIEGSAGSRDPPLQFACVCRRLKCDEFLLENRWLLATLPSLSRARERSAHPGSMRDRSITGEGYTLSAGGPSALWPASMVSKVARSGCRFRCGAFAF